jgi:hypothetical protein
VRSFPNRRISRSKRNDFGSAADGPTHGFLRPVDTRCKTFMPPCRQVDFRKALPAFPLSGACRPNPLIVKHHQITRDEQLSSISVEILRDNLTAKGFSRKLDFACEIRTPLPYRPCLNSELYTLVTIQTVLRNLVREGFDQR